MERSFGGDAPVMEEGINVMLNDSRKQLAKKHPDYRVFGIHRVIKFNELNKELRELVKKDPSTTHVVLLKFANNNAPEKGIRLAVLQYKVSEKTAEFKKFDEPPLTNELRKKLDEDFKKDSEKKRATIEKAIAALRRKNN
ncbi:MAG: hypothetical protein ACPL4N_03720 [Candidatus Norongarragalinales archaeon]